jgi:hypothetical protein
MAGSADAGQPGDGVGAQPQFNNLARGWGPPTDDQSQGCLPLGAPAAVRTDGARPAAWPRVRKAEVSWRHGVAEQLRACRCGSPTMLGWGLFLGLAMMAFALQFGTDQLERNIRRLLLIYALLGITSAAGYMAASPLAAVGFIAWGLVLYAATALLTVWFRRSAKSPSN